MIIDPNNGPITVAAVVIIFITPNCVTEFSALENLANSI